MKKEISHALGWLLAPWSHIDFKGIGWVGASWDTAQNDTDSRRWEVKKIHRHGQSWVLLTAKELELRDWHRGIKRLEKSIRGQTVALPWVPAPFSQTPRSAVSAASSPSGNSLPWALFPSVNLLHSLHDKKKKASSSDRGSASCRCKAVEGFYCMYRCVSLSPVLRSVVNSYLIIQAAELNPSTLRVSRSLPFISLKKSPLLSATMAQHGILYNTTQKSMQEQLRGQPKHSGMYVMIPRSVLAAWKSGVEEVQRWVAESLFSRCWMIAI